MPHPSPAHTENQPHLARYFERVRDQERTLVEAGFPALGCAAFTQSWFTAWLNRDVDDIVDHCTPDVTFVDPGTGGEQHSRPALHEYTALFYEAIPDLTFYPQRQGEVLPYWDFTSSPARVTIPWVAIGRFSGTLDLDIWPRIEGTNRCIELVGIDRYVFTEDFKIDRIDTDYDNFGVLQQVGLLPDLTNPVFEVAAIVERRIAAPLLKLTAR